MSEPDNRVSMLVDLKKYRLRIHKSSLHLLGNPEYIQLLVNPDDMAVAIMSRDMPGEQTLKINWDKLKSADCELYSRLLTLRLCEAFGCMKEGRSYRFTGYIIPQERIAYFPLKEMQPIDQY